MDRAGLRTSYAASTSEPQSRDASQMQSAKSSGKLLIAVLVEGIVGVVIEEPAPRPLVRPEMSTDSATPSRIEKTDLSAP